jgi:hypothetical protein
VSDIRAGGLPKDMKLGNQLVTRHGDQLEEKSLTICSGTDYININYQHVICPSAEIAKVRRIEREKNFFFFRFVYLFHRSRRVRNGSDSIMFFDDQLIFNLLVLLDELKD